MRNKIRSENYSFFIELRQTIAYIKINCINCIFQPKSGVFYG